MRHGWLTSFAVLLASWGLVVAEDGFKLSPTPANAAIASVPNASCCDPCECASDCSCPPCACPWDPGRVWLNAEYLRWRFKDSPLPVALTTTSNNSATPNPGAIGSDGSRVVIGNQDLDTHDRQGARFSAGIWLDEGHKIGMEGSYFFITSKTVSQGTASSGDASSPILGVPFFNADNMTESAFLRAIPGFVSGGTLLTFTSRMQGAEINGLANLTRRDALRVDLLGGFRFLELQERLSFATEAQGLGPANPVVGNNGLIFDTLDRFNTRNDFYGGQVGARAEYRTGRWFAAGTAKVALGDMFELAERRGDYLTNVLNNPAGGTPRSFSGFGAFVQHSNLGGSHRHEFAVVPEVGVNVGCEVARGARVFVGYDFLYASDVLLPGKQIDRTINFSQTVDSIAQGNAFAPGSRPSPALTSSDFWAQGISFGVELRY